MKLLLDEHYAPQIAVNLRALGHDVEHLEERGLKGVADEVLLQIAEAGRQALLTNNVRDFIPLSQTWAAAGRAHSGLVLTSDSRWPRAKNTVGSFVTALDAFLRERPGDDVMRNVTWWL